MSQPARALYMFLKLNQIPHEACRIDIAKGMKRLNFVRVRQCRVYLSYHM